MKTRARPSRLAAPGIARRIALVAALAAGLGVGSALAKPRLDQHNVPGATGQFGVSIDPRPLQGQTFTAGIHGKLARIGVDLSPNTGDAIPPGTIFADVYPTDADGAPDTTNAPLASGSVASTAIPPTRGAMTFIRLSQPTKLVDGTRYAIVLHTDDPIAGAYSWDGSSGPAPDQYPRGDQASRVDPTGAWTLFPGQDFFFQTFVAIRRHHHHHR